MFIFLLRSKHVLTTLILLIVTNFFHKILLPHIKVIFTTVKPNHRNLIASIVVAPRPEAFENQRDMDAPSKHLQIILLALLSRL